eukprot:m.23604 g.23604  ORF g.23604 m.23604 type:complete len:244 (-) comp8520_c0_seq1:1893-2624(-)
MDFMDEDVQRSESYRAAVQSGPVRAKKIAGVTRSSSSTDVVDVDTVKPSVAAASKPSTASVQLHSPAAAKPTPKPTPRPTPAPAAAPAAAKGKKDKKDKKRKSDVGAAAEDEERSYDMLIQRVSAISKPLASKKLTKNAYKLVKKAQKAKMLSRGVKEVGKAIRQGKTGVCFIAGDISPIDVISHMPVLCEEASIPYCYVPSKEDLGAAGQTKRPTSIVLVQKGSLEGFDEVAAEVAGLEAPQ